jgi:hypothetical protein
MRFSLTTKMETEVDTVSCYKPNHSKAMMFKDPVTKINVTKKSKGFLMVISNLQTTNYKLQQSTGFEMKTQINFQKKTSVFPRKLT